MTPGKTRLSYLTFCIALVLTTASLTYGQDPPCKRPVRFKVDIAQGLTPQPVSGRLLVFMTQNKETLEVVQPSWFELDKTWVAAQEVHNLQPGRSVDFDPDALASPAPFSRAPEGDYQIMALLDLDHSYPYAEMGAGDLRSVVLKVEKLSPADSDPIRLVLTKRLEDPHPVADTESIKVVTFESPLLSSFWGRPILMRAGVLLPPSYSNTKRRYPAVYRIHGFGGSYRSAWNNGPNLIKEMSSGSLPEMINVYLDGTCPWGHHEFADSVNNGPWGEALIREFIPYIESKFRMDAVPKGRLLTGHSSGGWSSLWLQVTYPDFFGGTWSTSPDPVDFRSFSGTDLTKMPAENLYEANGKPRNIFRYKGRDIFSWSQFVSYSRVLGEYGGQVESFEGVFSPRGADGRPMKLFDRETGAVDADVERAWERYDISRILQRDWKTLGPKLRGKLHLIVGTADNFHLEEAVYLLRDRLKALGSDASFEFIEGRDHLDLYQGDLSDRIMKAMYQVARPTSNAKE